MPNMIQLEDVHFRAAVKESQQLGISPEAYVGSLIEAASQSFDDILLPVRTAFKRAQFTEEELDAAVDEARRTHAASDLDERP